MSAARRVDWVPPFLVGACAAIAAEVALGILLYAGAGLMRSLTTVLAVEGIALGAGLWSTPEADGLLVDRLRRRWLLCLLSFLAAATYGTAWSLVSDIGQGRFDQALGLALLAGFPLFTCGSVIGGFGATASQGPERARRGAGGAAAIGAGVGFVATGLLLPRAPIPASLLVACLVMLSAAGMLYGIVLGARPSVELKATWEGPDGEARVEDHRAHEGEPTVRYLMEDDHVRARLSEEPEGVDAWDLVVLRSLAPSESRPWRALLVGGAGSQVPRAALTMNPHARVVLLERSEGVVELAREHMDVGVPEEAAGRLETRIGNLEDAIASAEAPFDLVLVDVSALAPLGGSGTLSRAARARLEALLSPAGMLAWGPFASDVHPASVAGLPTVALRRSLERGEQVVLVGRADPTELAERMVGFSVVGREAHALP